MSMPVILLKMKVVCQINNDFCFSENYFIETRHQMNDAVRHHEIYGCMVKDRGSCCSVHRPGLVPK